MGYLNGRLLRLLFLLCLIALTILPVALAQETTAGLQGIIKDPSGASIPGATLEISGAALFGTRTVTTDAGGNFRFAALPPGEYTLTVTASGFRAYKQTGINLAAGRLPSIEIQMIVGALSETVVVSGTALMVDTTQSKVAVTVSSYVMDLIPKGRSFESLIPFAAGAREEPLARTAGGGFQIDGASDSENTYLIDGVNTTNIQVGGVGRSFQMDFIQEVQIKSSSFEAEFGGALGGVINAVPKQGSNDWRGSLMSYVRSNGLNANNGDRGLRINPTLAQLNTTTRLDGTPEYYNAVRDISYTIEPGYEAGGPLLKDKLWLFSSYIPQLSSTRRLTTFTGANPGPRMLTQNSTQHNAYNRLDYGIYSRLRAFAGWNYAYNRSVGTLGVQDSNFGQRNTGATTDPNTLRADAGTVNPVATWSFGADWTPTSKLVATARFGYFFTNSPQRGIPIGTRYLYNNTVNAASRDLADQAFPSSVLNSGGYANIPANLATIYDAYKRKQWSGDVSYFAHFLGGTHTLKSGYFWAGQSNEVLRTYQGGFVQMYWALQYEPLTNTAICDQIKAQNLANFGKSLCQGRYGYFVIGNGVVNTGSSSQTAHALYLQDSWTVGHGLTLNLGIRFDKETQPPYDPKRFPTVEFGWGDKIAPRIGGAYDLLHNGKVKVYASYGRFFDIMKMGLARGSFGSDYWHNCVYAMDDTNYSAITPTYPIGGGCPATGPAPGVTVGRFIENVDWRATKADSRDPAISPDMKPMMQHEYVAGVDWAINKDWSLETRYSRKRLDRTIEDMAITDNLGFYIGNPGSVFADVLHRPVVIPDASGNNYLTTVPFCAECPPTIGAIRRYEGLEIRLSRRPTARWFGSFSYTYSRLRGNYAGLSNTDPTDGGGGRHNPNNHRAFDIPTMTYLPNGGIDDGPLSTDRPHTAKAYGSYRLRWLGMNTVFGITQLLYQGTPIGTCLPVIGSSSACQWAEGRGNFVNFTRAANGDFVKGSVDNDKRTPAYIQTDFSIRHEIPVSKTRETMKLAFQANVSNLFNNRAATWYYEFAVPTNLINPARLSRFSGDLAVDFGKVMNGYNYVDALNAAGAFGGNLSTGTKIQSALTLASRYGLPLGFQTARNIRLELRFTF